MLGGRIAVHHQLHVVDVHAAGGDVGNHQHPRRPGGERRQVAVTRRLGQVAVQVDRGDTRLGQLAGELAGLVLGAQEQDRRPVPEARVCTSLRLASAPSTWNTWWVIAETGSSGCRRVRDLLAQEPLDQLVDPVVQGRREQQPLPAGRGGRQDAGDARQEPQVGHVVGLVDHGDLDAVEADQLLAHQVLEPSRAGDDDVHTGLQRRLLTALRHPPKIVVTFRP